jgi:hypothetical protein
MSGFHQSLAKISSLLMPPQRFQVTEKRHAGIEPALVWTLLWSVMAFPEKMLSDATIFYSNSDLRRSAAGL